MNLLKFFFRLKIVKKYLPPYNLADVLKGDNVYCLCCEESFITFLPYGVIKRPNALCPRCGCLERHRLQWHFIHNQTSLFKTEHTIKLLHVAPENVFYKKFINNSLFDYVPCAKFGEGYTDVYPEKTVNADITNLDFSDNSFDVIYCSHVLEHVPEDIKAMKEFYRVLKPGGWAMLQVPLDKNRLETYEDFSITEPGKREIAFGQYDHVRVYGLDYKERLNKAGFKVDIYDYQAKFSQNDIFKYGFGVTEDIYMCHKEEK